MKDREKWMRLCEQASREQDPKKMIALTAEIIRLLNEKTEIIRLLSEKEHRLFHPVAKAEGNTMTQP
jgi:hypothetical protein